MRGGVLLLMTPEDRIRLMLTCADCGELLTSESQLRDLVENHANKHDVLEDATFRALKDHDCAKRPLPQAKTPPPRCRCYKCGEPIREGAPYVIAHLLHAWPDGRTKQSARELHPPCLDRLLRDGKSSSSKATYTVLSQEAFSGESENS